jgi:hypothetical protein
MDGGIKMELWICGKFIEETEYGRVWEFAGVFADKDLAIKACLDENYFIGPAILNEYLPEESMEWDGAYYPLIG